jgi:hypothetical protein
MNKKISRMPFDMPISTFLPSPAGDVVTHTHTQIKETPG